MTLKTASILLLLLFGLGSIHAQSGFDLRKDLRRQYLQQRRKVYGVKRDVRFATRELDRSKKAVSPLAGGIASDTESSNESEKPKSFFIPNKDRKGMIGEYHGIYNFLNVSTHTSLDTIQSVRYAQDGNSMLHPEVEVFGWHPHWMGDNYMSYNFNLLSTVAFFSYDVDPKTGNARNLEAIEQWKNTALVDSAHAKGCKALLTVTNHGSANNRLFLDNYLAQNIAIEEILKLIEEKGADGIDINFENIPKRQRANFSQFVQNVRVRFSKNHPEYTITVTLPAFDYNKAFDIANLEPYVDLFVLMGYDYNGPFSNSIGPISPLKDKIGGLEKAVDYYLANGMVPQKLLMGLPYFGGLWERRNETEKTEEFYFKRHLTYSQIRSNYKDVTPIYDTLSASMYFVTNGAAGKEEIWFDNAQSLSFKYDWAIDKGLGGVGIWALGYDHGYTDLWNVIDTKFTIDPTVVYADEEARNTVFYNFVQSIRPYKSVIVTSMFMLLGFMLIGFAISLFDWRVREALFNSNSIRFFFIAILFTALITAFILFDWFENGIVTFIIGLSFGAVITYAVSMLYSKNREETP